MPLKVWFAGSNPFGIEVLKALSADKRFEIISVVTTPARPVGRKQELQLPPLGQAGLDLGFEVATPAGKDEWRQLIADRERPDFLVVISYGMILPQFVLDWPRLGPINVHPSLLPKYRGATPVPAALANGDSATGVAIMKMEMKMDAGPLYRVEQFELDGTETALDVFDRVAEITAKTLPETLVQIADGLIEPVPQLGEAVYCGKIAKADGELKLAEMEARTVINRYRAYAIWPGVFWFDRNQKRVGLRELGFVTKQLALKPGSVNLVDGSVWLGTKTEAIELLTVQPEGKQAMAARDWYNGYQAS